MQSNDRGIGPRVLLVDDDHGFVETFGAMLRINNYYVMSALTYASALNGLRTEAPHVLITDLQLGHEDGWSLIREARRARPSLPVLVVTAWPYAVPKDGPDARIPVFLKPFDPEDVLRYLASVMRSVMRCG